jgi:hypothetical protein
MPAARYWRIIGVETNGGGDLELSELALYEGATRVDGSATLTCTAAPIAGALANLQDADTGTTTRFAGADVFQPGFALAWDFGAGVTKDVDSVGLASPVQDRYAYGFALQYSSDTTTWANLYLVDRTKFAGANTLQQHTYADWKFLTATAFLYRFESPTTAANAINTALESIYPMVDTDAIAASGGAANTIAGGKFGRGVQVNGADFGFIGIGGQNANTLAKVDLHNTQVFTLEMFANLVSTTNVNYTLASSRPSNAGEVLVLALTRTATGLSLKLYRQSTTPILSTAEFPNTSTFRHYALTRNGGTFTLFVDGLLSAQATGVTLPASAFAVSSAQFSIGSNVTPVTGVTLSGPNVVLDSIRLVNDLELYTADFTPPTTDLFLRPDHDPLPAVRTAAAAPTTLSEYPTPAFTIAEGNPTTFDLSDGGTATIFGTVKRDAEPTDLPVARRVRLYDERGRRFIRETWSDANGDFSFVGINPDGLYTAIAYDHLGQFRAVISDALVAEA